QNNLRLAKKVGRTACKIISGERLKTRWVFKSAGPTDFDDLKNRQNRLMCGGTADIFAQANLICRRKNIYLAIFACVAQRREQKLERVARRRIRRILWFRQGRNCHASN
ncbi:MAG TPA: hypothetical protein IAA52_04390, partial [Candidatus Pullichristensenella stercorigallinarum]|nr:hypothetical protein [Candidatus Pullichristensenella stercorigallinarum]